MHSFSIQFLSATIAFNHFSVASNLGYPLLLSVFSINFLPRKLLP